MEVSVGSETGGRPVLCHPEMSMEEVLGQAMRDYLDDQVGGCHIILEGVVVVVMAGW